MKISPLIFKKYPKLKVGIIILKNIDNTGDDKKIFHLLEEMQEYVKGNFISEELAKHELISPWRTAYSEFGSKPSKYHSSIEALIRRIIKGEKIPQINKLVDLYNFISLKHLVPMGADDLDKIEGKITLQFSDGAEKFVPLGSSKTETPEKGEVIYKDHRKVLCRRWNWRDSETTKITEQTKNAIIYVEGLPPLTKEQVEKVCKEIKDLTETFLGAKAEYKILDLAHSEVEI